MKKVVKGLLALLLMVPLFAGIVNQANVAEAAEIPETVNIYLHKRIFRDLRWTNNEELDSWFYDNDGNPIDREQMTNEDELMLQNSLPFNGAMYDIYDATPWYQEVLAKGTLPNGATFKSAKEFADYISKLTKKEAIKMAQESDLTKLNSQSVVTKKTTMPDGRELEGIASFTDLRSQDGQQNKAYLIVETGITDKKELNVDMNKLG